MKKIILLCLISVSLILSGCDTSDDKWTEPATDEEMKLIETELTELYTDAFSCDVNVFPDLISFVEIELGIRGKFTIFLSGFPPFIISYDDAKAIGENCAKLFDRFIEEYNKGNFRAEFYYGGGYSYRDGILYYHENE